MKECCELWRMRPGSGALQMRCFVQDYLGSQPQLERHLRFSGHCWRSRNEVVSNLVLWEPKHGQKSIVGQACTFVAVLEGDTGVPRDCSSGWRQQVWSPTSVAVWQHVKPPKQIYLWDRPVCVLLGHVAVNKLYQAGGPTCMAKL